jgi:hypothetical protein
MPDALPRIVSSDGRYDAWRITTTRCDHVTGHSLHIRQARDGKLFACSRQLQSPFGGSGDAIPRIREVPA